ncbi:pyridoxamine 5'-phosphate oxidase [Nonlabens ulvanivorans]|nr:pyridoxamine 5'-phosphate oxidase [Nonlabens ulvanivorans]
MQRDLQNLRKNYSIGALVEDNLPQDPYDLFEEWFNEAKSHMSVDEVNAMSLTTLGVDGYPKSRIVLLKEVENGCFIFYSNYGSEKGEIYGTTFQGFNTFFLACIRKTDHY